MPSIFANPNHHNALAKRKHVEKEKENWQVKISRKVNEGAKRKQKTGTP